jgi:putative transposase
MRREEAADQSSDERAKVVQERLARGYPLHSPPHPVRDQPMYLISAACYRHVRHASTPARRQQLFGVLYGELTARNVDLAAWVILPDHYHLLVQVSDFGTIGESLGCAHRVTATDWNGADSARGRQVWYRYTDRAMRSDGHYYTTLNYIHHNPVKHGWTRSPYDWAESSVHWYLKHFGREWLRDLWVRYPLRSYGEGWDDF